MDKKILAAYLDFADHYQDATPRAIKELCQQVKKHGFHSAFVNPCYVTLAKDSLPQGKVGTVVSFPLGQDHQDAKVVVAMKAVRDGADELDVSMNVGWFKAKKYDWVLEEMKAVVTAAKNIRHLTLVKFIIETGFLNDSEIKKASQLVLEAGADFVKTCSGWGPRGASLKDVKLIRRAIGDKIKVKVAGGIDTYKEATDFIKVGANRIGTSQAIEIVKGLR